MSELSINFESFSQDQDYTGVNQEREFVHSIRFTEPGTPEAGFSGQSIDMNKYSNYWRPMHRKARKRDKRRISICIYNNKQSSRSVLSFSCLISLWVVKGRFMDSKVDYLYVIDHV